MKIALVCTEKLPVPPVAGGAIQIYIKGILPVLSKHHKITIYSLQHHKLPKKYKKGKIRHIRVKGKTADEYINNVKKEIANEKYDLIHVFNRPLWVLRLNSAAPDTSFSLSLHNSMFARKKIDADRAKKVIDKVKFISTVSQFIADEVKDMYPSAAEKLHPLYSGVVLDEYKPIWSKGALKERIAMRKEYGIDNCKVVLWIGRLGKKKGAHVLMKAMKDIMEYRSDVALVFVGSKWYGKNETDSYVQKLQTVGDQLKGPVIFTGFLPPEVIPKYYNMGDIFVCTSQWNEPLARIHYEAMAAGLPIITTDRGGNAEVIEQNVNGIAIKEYNNPDVFIEKINSLLDNEDIALNLGKMGRKLVEEKYTLDKVANKLLELFSSIENEKNIILEE